MSPAFSANAFTGLSVLVIAFQLALVAGAPWGALTQGGRIAGPLPPEGRVIALLSAAVLMCFIYFVRARAAPAARFRRSTWGVVAYCAIGVIAHGATPSAAERAVWLPVIALMFVASLHVARRPEPVAPTGAA